MMDNDVILTALENRLSLNQQAKVLVVGLGETGFSVAKFLHQFEIPFAVIDSRDKPPLNDALLQDYPDTPVFTGGFDAAAFEVATHLIVSPGVSLTERSVQKTLQAGARLISDIDLFACSTDKPIAAITGSNGKSTVTTLLGTMAQAAGVNVAIGGNLGVPALDLLAEDKQLYVLELSSFQLERCSQLDAKVATVLNISADHLDRHDGMDDYAKVKEKIFAGNGMMVLNEDDERVKAMHQPERSSIFFSINKQTDFWLQQEQQSCLMHDDQVLLKQQDLQLEGLHNVSNALAALAMGWALQLPLAAMCQALKTFKGLEHRMQRVAKLQGVTWVNDSKATNVGACVAALQGYRNKVVLIAGGDAKGADMQELLPAIKEKAKSVVLMGRDAELIETAINGCVPSYRAENIIQAVQVAATQAQSGETVLLSPACASLDQFKNYQDRGNQFSRAVIELQS